MLIGIKMKKSVAEVGHNGCLKMYVDRAFKSFSPKWLGIFG